MKRYKRLHEQRDSSHITNRSSLESLNQKILVLCNYLHIKDKHINLEELLLIFNSFKIEFIPIYLRLFNEIPKVLLKSFIKENQIDITKVIEVHNRLKELSSFRIDEFEI